MTETVRVTPTDTHWRIPHQRPEAEEPEAEEWQLVSLASHELRTPLTALRTEVELALLGDRDASELRAALRSAADEIRRVCRLADDMLLLAQADQGRLPLRPRALEPRALLAAAATRARAAACAGALLASGASSSSVGTYAGQVVMAGFTNLRIPLTARRAITMLPALIILATGTNATSALVLSQVVLSFGIPFALVPLVVLTSRASVMGRHVNRRNR
jgi:signal transduction histidine kinase